MEYCRYEKKDHVVRITITRPEVMNALHAPASRELSAACAVATGLPPCDSSPCTKQTSRPRLLSQARPCSGPGRAAPRNCRFRLSVATTSPGCSVASTTPAVSASSIAPSMPPCTPPAGLAKRASAS